MFGENNNWILSAVIMYIHLEHNRLGIIKHVLCGVYSLSLYKSISVCLSTTEL